MMPTATVTAVGRGEAREPDRDLLGPDVRSIVRYADPIVWFAATAIARALRAEPTQSQVVGLIVVSDDGPLEAMQSIADAASEGYSSPLRYPASNPGSIVGVSAIALQLHGPTLNLIMRPEHGVPTALLAARGWLSGGHCDLVAVAAVRRNNLGDCLARCAALTQTRNDNSAGDEAGIEDWLAIIE